MGLSAVEPNVQNLLFENNFGDGELVSASEINQIISDSTKNFKFSLVFVAACDSEDVGKILRLGAKHVICVEKGRFVLDKAAILFTKTFYQLIYQKEEEICTAFDEAKRSVQYNCSAEEANLFKIFTDHPKD